MSNESNDTENLKAVESVSQLCGYCHEPLLAGEQVGSINITDRWHLECLMRGVIGSVGHQQGQCSCHGGIDSSEDGLTRREAARRAHSFWLEERAATRIFGFRVDEDA